MVRHFRILRLLDISMTLFAFLGATSLLAIFLQGVSQSLHNRNDSQIQVDFNHQAPLSEEQTIRGGLAAHIWYNVCIADLKDFITSNYFPRYPDNQHVISESQTTYAGRNYAQRIHGYIHPPDTGFYQIGLFSRGQSELWLTKNDSQGTVIAKGTPRKRSKGQHFGSFMTSDLFLNKDVSIRIEVFHFQTIFSDTVKVMWLQPGKAKLAMIDSVFLSRDKQFQSLPQSVLKSYPKSPSVTTVLPQFSLVAFLTQWIWNSALPSCAFELYPRGKYRGKAGSPYALRVERLHRDENGRELEKWKENAEVKNVVQRFMDGLEKVFEK
ncbi:predicted protein [Nematostella vectensis]|uniref:PA14 domain-containing protein n=2 Tax=Nematostella vectensis TaxID=45351 RepID=A7RTG4_NEMVE|nr:predicted protein [Nematostella vectensis]|eukprot:XP_001637324.1 predicted protein [Nematostella vectensis]